VASGQAVEITGVKAGSMLVTNRQRWLAMVVREAVDVIVWRGTGFDCVTCASATAGDLLMKHGGGGMRDVAMGAFCLVDSDAKQFGLNLAGRLHGVRVGYEDSATAEGREMSRL
jgi:hypothetical protein